MKRSELEYRLDWLNFIDWLRKFNNENQTYEFKKYLSKFRRKVERNYDYHCNNLPKTFKLTKHSELHTKDMIYIDRLIHKLNKGEFNYEAKNLIVDQLNEDISKVVRFNDILQFQNREYKRVTRCKYLSDLENDQLSALLMLSPKSEVFKVINNLVFQDSWQDLQKR